MHKGRILLKIGTMCRPAKIYLINIPNLTYLTYSLYPNLWTLKEDSLNINNQNFIFQGPSTTPGRDSKGKVNAGRVDQRAKLEENLSLILSYSDVEGLPIKINSSTENLV